MTRKPVKNFEFYEIKEVVYYSFQCAFCGHPFFIKEEMWETGCLTCPCGAGIKRGEVIKGLPPARAGGQ